MPRADAPAMPNVLTRAVRIRGAVPLPRGCDEAALLAQVLADLRGRGCRARMTEGAIVVESRSDGRGSVLSFVDGGLLRLGRHGADRTLEYEFSTLGGLQLCAVVSVVAAGLGWFALDSAALAAFGLLAPLLWLYGANFVLAAIRVPAWLERLCRAAPMRLPGPWG